MVIHKSVKQCLRRNRISPRDMISGAWNPYLVIVSIETQYLRKAKLCSRDTEIFGWVLRRSYRVW
jgi:hypothetical protein